MKWSDEYNIGINEIDKQHQHIITAINALESAVLQKKAGEMLIKISKALSAYAKSHFDFEETLLERHGYPSLKMQLEEHSHFILKIKEFDRQMAEASNPQKLGMQICNFLREWFIDHIIEKDKRYLRFLKRKGVT